jgi:hypothetical protein
MILVKRERTAVRTELVDLDAAIDEYWTANDGGATVLDYLLEFELVADDAMPELAG